MVISSFDRTSRFIVGVALAVIVITDAADANGGAYDLDDDNRVDQSDWIIVVENWTGEIRDGSGTSTPSQGDFDGDGDVDDMDMLEFAENREEGPFCIGGYPDLPVYPSVTPAALEYDPATGQIVVDTSVTECLVAAFTLTSESGEFDKIFDEGDFDFDFDSDFDSNDMLILMERWTGAGRRAVATIDAPARRWLADAARHAVSSSPRSGASLPSCSVK